VSPPVVDVVVLSYAKTPELAAMTQETVSSCVATAGQPVNIWVLEQQEGCTYEGTQTVHAPEPFNYNGFCNRGAELGSAEWIVFANNDLIFHGGWLDELLAADHPVVSPKCPRDQRQRDLFVNTVGHIVGRHLSGWCFMMRRELWQEIGGFDECCTFWYSDNVVVEQLRAVDAAPMLVPAAVVEHLWSQTLSRMPNYDELTRKQRRVFERERQRLSAPIRSSMSRRSQKGSAAL
jgi:GT2 family glycosyltransferase